MNELKPCPFCGGEARRGEYKGSSVVYVDHADECCFNSDEITFEQFVKLWENRDGCKTCAPIFAKLAEAKKLLAEMLVYMNGDVEKHFTEKLEQLGLLEGE